MSELINAKGLDCPMPVVLTKKVLDRVDEVTVLVDNEIALENLKRLASSQGCAIEAAKEPDGSFRIHLKKQGHERTGDASKDRSCPEVPPRAAGPTVFVIASNVMGYGNDELGAALMKAFLHTAVGLESLPEVMIFYNTGVKLTASDSDVIDDLQALEEKGVRLLICGTCLNFFNLSGRTGAGSISNMYDIVDILSTAGRIVKP